MDSWNKLFVAYCAAKNPAFKAVYLKHMQTLKLKDQS